MKSSLLEQFLQEEANPYVIDAVRDAARASGERYLTFNRFNIRLDLETGMATIEDELDPEGEMAVPIDDLLASLPNE